MSLTRASRLGVILLTAGAVTVAGVAIWLKTTREILADFSLPTHAEAVSRDFAVDHDGPLYKMNVRFGSAISETMARCLLGATKSDRYPDLDCGDTAPVLEFTWELRRDGQTGGSGSSGETGTVLATDGETQVAIVAFPAQKNHRYQVTLKSERNADRIEIPSPRVQIELDSFVKEGIFIIAAILDVLAVLLCLVGFTMLAFGFLRGRLKRASA